MEEVHVDPIQHVLIALSDGGLTRRHVLSFLSFVVLVDGVFGRAGVTTSVIAFGSFALPVKSPQVLEADVGPIVFQL
jgi:hypothetical protein